jgi:hypothetical protein
MSDQQLVISIFKDEAAADAAVEEIKAWEAQWDEVRLNAIGVLVLDEHGKLKTHKAGARSTSKGAGIGLILAMATPPGLVAGLVAGSVLGAMHHKGLGLDAGERERLGRDLEGGKAAVGILAGSDRTKAITSILEDFGGQAQVHDVSDESLAEAETVADEPPVGTTES